MLLSFSLTEGVPVSDLPGRISVREVGPRDGLQNEEPVPTAAKVELINRLSGTGLKAGGPDYLLQFVSQRAVSENTMRHGLVV